MALSPRRGGAVAGLLYSNVLLKKD